MSKKIPMVFVVLLIIMTIVLVCTLVKKQVVNEEDDGDNIAEIIEDECTEEYAKLQNATTVTATEEKVSANAILILKKYYQKCEHTINEYVEIPQEIVNMTKSEVEKQYPDWKVIGFEPGKVTLYKEFDDVCGEHFRLKVENGKVVVYIDNSDGTQSLYERTDISSEYLTETDLINMQDGLEIYGKEELNQIIEDFE